LHFSAGGVSLGKLAILDFLIATPIGVWPYFPLSGGSQRLLQRRPRLRLHTLKRHIFDNNAGRLCTMTVSMLGWASAAAGSSLAWVAAAALEVHVLTNGAPYTEVPTTVSADSWEELRHRIESDEKLGYKLRMAEDEDWWLAEANGKLVNSWDTLVALPGANPLLNAVPAGRPYQWGPRELG